MVYTRILIAISNVYFFRLGIELPEKWDLQPKDTNGKEKDVHLVPLDPVKHAAEYDEVSRALHLTARANIQSIERVQNPALFRAYSVRKQAMDKKDGSNEMRLFHGTAGTSCQTINHFGFNRSYCGKNGKKTCLHFQYPNSSSILSFDTSPQRDCLECGLHCSGFLKYTLPPVISPNLGIKRIKF